MWALKDDMVMGGREEFERANFFFSLFFIFIFWVAMLYIKIRASYYFFLNSRVIFLGFPFSVL